MPLTWTPDMTTGLADIDEQHRNVIAAVNGLDEEMAAGHSREALTETLSSVISYAAWHFAREEECFTRYRCPAAAANIAHHKEFVAAVTSFRERLVVEGPTPELAGVLRTVLGPWLMDHICKVDAKLATSVRAAAA